MSQLHKAIFLDRDGTINEDTHYLHEPEEVILCPTVGEALKRLQNAGFLLIVITNQSGVGRGYFPMTDVYAVNDKVSQLLQNYGVTIRHYYIAPEAPSQPSIGRKPSPAFIYKARDDFQIDLSQSWMIGDKFADLQTGWNANLKKSLLVRTGKGVSEENKYSVIKEKSLVFDNLLLAAEYILKEK